MKNMRMSTEKSRVTGDSQDILVTGGTGIIGRRIAERLANNGHSVRVLTRKERESAHPGIRFFNGDLLDRDVVAASMAGCRAVFHCAAELRDTENMEAVNILGTENVYSAASKERVRFFCHLSSVGVIGRVRASIVDENTSCHPMNRYEITKLKGEEIVGRGLDGCRTVILRPTNVFAEERFEVQSYKSFLKVLRVMITGRENAHLVYADDVADAAVYLFVNYKKNGIERFIVSSDEEPENTARGVYSYVRNLLGYKASLVRFCMPIEIPYLFRFFRYGHSNRGDICYSSRHLFSTGFQMSFGFKEGLRRVVEHYLTRRVKS